MSKSGDPRLGELLSRSYSSSFKSKIGILGYPCDIGVARNHGRVGAKHGPQCIRKKFPVLGPVFNPEYDINLDILHLNDRGDVAVSEDNLEENHIHLTEAVKNLFDNNDIGIIIGGGNDQSYPNARGLMNSKQSGYLGVVNVDAHFDVRPLIEGKLAHSGSPFRQLLEDVQFNKDGGSFVEFAVQGNQCSKDHADYIMGKGGSIKWLSKVEEKGVKNSFKEVLSGFKDRPVFLSFDIDSIKGSDCPGVSCPAVRGLTSQDALDICYLGGLHPHTQMLDLSEYNPTIEEDRTARLVVNMIYYFLLGVAQRFN